MLNRMQKVLKCKNYHLTKTKNSVLSKKGTVLLFMSKLLITPYKHGNLCAYHL